MISSPDTRYPRIAFNRHSRVQKHACIYTMLLLMTVPAYAGDWRVATHRDNCLISSNQWGEKISIQAYDAENIGFFVPGGIKDGHIVFINEGEVRDFYFGNDGDYGEVDSVFLDLFARSETMVLNGAEYSLGGSQNAVDRFYDCIDSK